MTKRRARQSSPSCRTLGLRGVDAGVLKNSIALESLTPVLLHINRRYKSVGSGIRITGIPETE